MEEASKDTVCLLIVCSDNQKIVWCKETAFLPWTTQKLDSTWSKSIEDLLTQVVPFPTATRLETRRFVLVRLVRLWWPMESASLVQRATFFVEISKDEGDKLKLSSRYNWSSISGLSAKGVVDPECQELFRNVQMGGASVVPSFSLTEVDETSVMSGQQETSNEKRIKSHLVEAAGVGAEDQKRVYKEFLELCHPRRYMAFEQFEKFMTMFGGWERPLLPALFRCFNSRKAQQRSPHFLTFSEFLSGVCACEPNTPHGEQAGEARCRHIFWYYNKDSSGQLSFKEFCSLVRDIRAAKGFSTDTVDVENEAAVSAKVFGCEDNDSLTLTDFLTGVGQLKFRGTSLLLRSPESVLGGLRNKSPQPSSSSPNRKRSRPQPKNPPPLTFDDTSLMDEDHINKNDLLTPTNGGSELSSESEDGGSPYDFATHVVKVKRSGQVVDVSSLWDMGPSQEAVTASSCFTSSQRTNFGRLQSIKAFNDSSEANEMLKGLRYFERTSKNSVPPKPPLSWGKVRVDMKAFGTSLLELCHYTRGLLVQEPRLVKLKSPTYILGDLHGNFSDLVCFEKVLWRMGPNLVPANFLFLGDYVDRGDFGVEVVAYLFAQKVTAPTKFHLLRGNHECRSIQLNFTFHQECLDKFGKDLGGKIWEEINKVFDVMPIAALIDKKIFCVHGGIPPPWMGDGTIHALDNVNKIIPDPEMDEPLVWEYLWNDPLPSSETLSPESQDDLGDSESKGFVANYRRGTGHMFSDTALDEFLRKNGLSHVIRAHEVKQAGFQVQHGQKLLTVFSSSKYCGGVNEAACALADNNKLRLIRLDTA